MLIITGISNKTTNELTHMQYYVETSQYLPTRTCYFKSTESVQKFKIKLYE